MSPSIFKSNNYSLHVISPKKVVYSKRHTVLTVDIPWTENEIESELTLTVTDEFKKDEEILSLSNVGQWVQICYLSTKVFRVNFARFYQYGPGVEDFVEEEKQS
jgi:hypothetical protein